MITPVLPTYARAPIEVERGEGPWLWDRSGKRWLDFGSGVAVNTLGHAHPRLVRALTEQAQKLWHASNLLTIPGQEALAHLLIAHSFADTVFFCNSGAEAIECTIKMARKYHSHHGRPERYRIITFEGSFHGRTMATISAAGAKKLTDGFGPLLDGFDVLPFGDHAALEAAIGPQTAGILIEPVQGEGGIRPVPPQCLRGLRALCDQHGILLLLDEVQSGMGRTGKLWAHEWAGITPDIMGVAKGIGGGFPLGACLATEKAAAGMTIGSHGSTYGGNPLAMAVGQEVVTAVLEPGFLEAVQLASARLRQGLAAIVDEFPDILDGVRGQGLLLGLHCVVPNGDFLLAARDAGLLLVMAGDNVVRVLPPLNVDEGAMTEALARLRQACVALQAKKEQKA